MQNDPGAEADSFTIATAASEEETFHQFILIRGDHVINPEDRIMPEDRMVVMMPLTGG